jgi:hypothetical protein
MEIQTTAQRLKWNALIGKLFVKQFMMALGLALSVQISLDQVALHSVVLSPVHAIRQQYPNGAGSLLETYHN